MWGAVCNESRVDSYKPQEVIVNCKDKKHLSDNPSLQHVQQ